MQFFNNIYGRMLFCHFIYLALAKGCGLLPFFSFFLFLFFTLGNKCSFYGSGGGNGGGGGSACGVDGGGGLAVMVAVAVAVAAMVLRCWRWC